jgi:hypothetical protein
LLRLMREPSGWWSHVGSCVFSEIGSVLCRDASRAPVGPIGARGGLYYGREPATWTRRRDEIRGAPLKRARMI